MFVKPRIWKKWALWGCRQTSRTWWTTLTKPPSRALLLACLGVQPLHLPQICVREGACQARWRPSAERMRQCCCFWGSSPQNAWGLCGDSGGKPLWSASSLQLCCCYSSASERTRHALVLCIWSSTQLLVSGSVGAASAAFPWLHAAPLPLLRQLCWTARSSAAA